RSIDLGFQKESLLEITLYPKPGGYQKLDLNSYHKQLLARISSLPGVGSVSFGDATIPSPQGGHDTVSPMTADSSTGALVWGIARNARIFDIRDATTPVIFLSSFQYPHEWGGLLVRTKEAPEALAKTIGHDVESLGREYVLRSRTVEQVISMQLVEERVTAML